MDNNKKNMIKTQNIKKLSKIINKMSDNSNANVKVIKNNILFLSGINKKDYLLNMAVYTDCDEENIMRFLNSAYFVIELPNKIYDENGNSFLHVSALTNRGFRFTERLFMFVIRKSTSKEEWEDIKINKYEFLTHKNNDKKNFMDILLENDEIFKNELLDYFLSLLNKITYISIDYIINYYEQIINKVVNSGMIDNKVLNLDFYEELKKLCKKNILLSESFYKGSKEERIKLLNRLFGDVNYSDESGNFFWECTRYISNRYTIEDLHIFLDCGVDPNFKKDNKTIIHDIMHKDSSSTDIINWLKVFIKYGYDVNQNPSLIKRCLDTWGADERTFEVYKFLCEHGFDSSTSDIDINYIINNSSSATNKIINLYWNNCIYGCFSNAFKEVEMELEENFFDKLYNSINDFNLFKEQIQGLLKVDEKNVLELIVENVIEMRKDSIENINDYISVSDVFDGIKYLVVKVQNDFLNNVDVAKQKIYNLETN